MMSLYFQFLLATIQVHHQYEVNFGNGFFGTTQISSEGTNTSGIGKFEYDVQQSYRFIH